MKQLFSILAVVSLVSTAAFAEDKVIRESDKTVFRKKTTIDFTDVAIDGELTKPEGSYSVSKKKTTFKTLIKVRDNFNPELQKSVENL
ncbi:MAG: hypothetical protein DI536_03205 [Archangium gephyra]|uniref:Uncharacterized protein n=1 Tax=Archangium gephyra TaxID=48 RepID=A0A2W5U190_9BACT|nr:MAG: hypothetical protein DI536_03205 [Archangium gephyra]